jgi:uncharacterized membrane protein
MLGRGIAGVGVVLGLIAIWVGAASNGAVSTKYWDDGTYGGVLLILAILAALALAAAIATDRRDYDLAYGAIGGIGFGLYLFVPAVFAFDQWKLLDTGAWLGLCSALTFIGATIATWDSDRPLARPPAAGALLAFAGLALVFAGIFPTYESGQGSYWDINGNGHSFAITLIILIVLTALSIGAAYSMAAGMDSAILLGAITFGAALAVPVNNAFNNFGDLEAGAWLTAIGGILVAVGVAVMWQMRSEEVPTPAPSPPAA